MQHMLYNCGRLLQLSRRKLFSDNCVSVYLTMDWQHLFLLDSWGNHLLWT